MRFSAIVSMLGILALIVVFSGHSSFAARCKPPVSVKGQITNYLAARSSARVQWRKKVKRLYGKKYARWYAARDRYFTCKRQGYSRRCRATGRPCR